MVATPLHAPSPSFPFLNCLFPSMHSSSYCFYVSAPSVASSSSAIPFSNAEFSVLKAANCFSKVDAGGVDKDLRADSRAKLAWRGCAAVFRFAYTCSLENEPPRLARHWGFWSVLRTARAYLPSTFPVFVLVSTISCPAYPVTEGTL